MTQTDPHTKRIVDLSPYTLQQLEAYAAAKAARKAMGEQITAGNHPPHTDWENALKAESYAEGCVAYGLLADARDQGLIPKAEELQQVGA